MHLRADIHNVLQDIVEFIFDKITQLFYVFRLFLKPIFSVIFNKLGIKINGSKSWDIQVKDNRFYGMVVARGATGLVEALLEGYIDCEDLEKMLEKVMLAPRFFFHIERYHPYRLLKYYIHRYFDVLSFESKQNITKEYYEHNSNYMKEIFGSSPQFSTMLLYDLNEVEEANTEQIEELIDEGTFQAREHIAKKLKLEPGMKVLDIGCGFGGLVKHLAERYKVQATGVVNCKVMADHAAKVCKGLPVKIICNDYRAVSGKFDRIVSVEMFEHVGENHHREYFEKVNSLLNEDGIFVLHANHIRHDYIVSYTPMLEKIINMYCYFPRLEEIIIQSKGMLIIEDIQNIGYCSGVTIKAVLKNMIAKKEKILKKLSEKEFRQWYVNGLFTQVMALSAKYCVYQIVFSKNGLRYAYQY